MGKSIISILNIVLILFVLPACTNSTSKKKTSEFEGAISISGAFALYPLTVKWADEYQKIHPNVRIDISAGGAGKGMTDALSGMVDLGMFSRGISDSEKTKGCWWMAVAKDAVLPTMNDQNPLFNKIKSDGIQKSLFENIFIKGGIVDWGQVYGLTGNYPMNVYTRSDACGAAQMWGEFLGKDQENLLGIGVFGDPGMADAIKRDPNGIGYNNVIYIYDLKTRKCYEGLDVIPVDLNNNGTVDNNEKFYGTIDEIMIAIRDRIYPSPPARDLYFVAHGKPDHKVTIEFLKWILVEGQAFVNEAGYVRLSSDKIQAELTKLK